MWGKSDSKILRGRKQVGEGVSSLDPNLPPPLMVKALLTVEELGR